MCVCLKKTRLSSNFYVYPRNQSYFAGLTTNFKKPDMFGGWLTFHLIYKMLRIIACYYTR